MITYIVKTAVCSAILVFIYHLVLERERMYVFNRYYLIFAVMFSFIVPLITIGIKIPELLPSVAVNNYTFDIQGVAGQQIINIPYKGSSFPGLLLLVYFTVTAFLFIRFLRNLYHVARKASRSRVLDYSGSKLALTKGNGVPHSFLNYIFVSESDYMEGIIEEEILNHELAHVRQLHSLDILLIEAITIFAWVNPLIFLYRRAVRLNHEFLADDYVTSRLDDIQAYQMLLVGLVIQPVRLSFTSSFNYIDVKKRIMMMIKKVSRKYAILKQIALIPVFAVLTLVFASKTAAQGPERAAAVTPATEQGVSQELLKEYQSILDKNKISLKDGKQGFSMSFGDEDLERLEKIFLQMSKEQQENQMIVFVPKSSLYLPKTVPTADQINSFTDPAVYGVWIDGKRVDNEELRKYVNTDFSFVAVSKLYPNATNYGKHEFQVDLMTNSAYEDHYNRALAQKGYLLRAAHKPLELK